MPFAERIQVSELGEHGRAPALPNAARGRRGDFDRRLKTRRGTTWTLRGRSSSCATQERLAGLCVVNIVAGLSTELAAWQRETAGKGCSTESRSRQTSARHGAGAQPRQI